MSTVEYLLFSISIYLICTLNIPENLIFGSDILLKAILFCKKDQLVTKKNVLTIIANKVLKINRRRRK